MTSNPHRRDKFWMVTFASRDPHLYDELPQYFPTKRAATQWLAELQTRPDDHGYAEDETFAVKVADQPWEAIEWPWSDGSQW